MASLPRLPPFSTTTATTIRGLAAGAKHTVPASSPASRVTTAPSGDGRLDLKAIARQAARDAERLVIAETLDRVHWNRAKAARILQISYKALLYKIVDCGLGQKILA